MTKSKSSPENSSRIPSKAVYENKHQQFPPTRRSIPNGFDFDLEEVWWPRLREKQKQRHSLGEGDEGLCRTVPTEYYSRHQLLRKESANYIMAPTSKGQKGSTPVFTFRPGTTLAHSQATWPARAHDGSTERNGQLSGPDVQRSDTPSSPDSDAFYP